MAPNKEWMGLFNDRLNEKYKLGVEQFLNYAFRKTGDEYTIRCPCIKCNNTNSGSREEVKLHLFVNGIIQNYITWYHHGERSGEPYSDDEDSDIGNHHEEIEEIINDLYPDMVDFDRSAFEKGSSSHNDYKEEPNDEAKAFYRLLKDSEQPVYPGCLTSKLYVLVNLLHIKSIGRWSNESFDMLLQLLKRILPIGSTSPHTYYDAKKVIKDLGLSYKRIDACINDCMLYWKEEKESNLCNVCGASRWKKDRRNGDTKVRENGKNVVMKTLHYFPLKPRLQRLFMSKKTAIDMRWHHEKRVDDGVMRHPADSKAWKSFNDLHKDFSVEPRNVRLGLASDGFQPFTHSKTSYSIWPVILIPYNLPPWICMKESNFILSILVPGPDSPGDAIDVYLKPLIEELKELWEEGIETFDASTQKNFKLKASLMWTINDFPAYGNLSGWSTKGKMACPCCNKDTCSMRLVNGKKQSYMGHRRYLPRNHKWRNAKDLFDGTKEVRGPPVSLFGLDLLSQMRDLERVILTKDAKMKVKITHAERGDNWNKKSIFFELPYWSSLLLRHNLDVMHIEKNICDNILGTIMNMQGKTKDNVQAHLDLQAMNIRSELHPIRKGEKLHLPAASYTLSKVEKHLFCLFFQQLRVPDGFSSNISQSVNMKEHKISGLKSHDCHVLLQHLLPLAIRGLLPKIVCESLIELSLFFTSLGSTTLNIHELDKIDSQIPITLCKLEQIFPPSFFDVMVHLPVHLAYEAKIAGPIQYRWMYPIERMLHGLKQLIRNMARPEGSIAEGYIANECMTLCSRYLKGIKTKFNTLERNNDGGFPKNEGNISIFSLCGRPLGGSTTRNLNNDEWQQAHIYILKNCDEVQPYIEEFMKMHQNTTTQVSNEEWNRNFIDWFKNKVEKMQIQDQSSNCAELLSLSRGPTKYARCFSGYVVNGYRFRIEARDNGSRTQNSGVCVIGDIGNEVEHVEYYGVLVEILELQYLNKNRVVLFQCKWFDVYDRDKGIKVDEYGFTSINCYRTLKINEPFILASQASQVFYAVDNTTKAKGWHVVMKTQPRDLYKMPQSTENENNEVDLDEAYQHEESFDFDCGGPSLLDIVEQSGWTRTKLEPIVVDIPTDRKKRKRKQI